MREGYSRLNHQIKKSFNSPTDRILLVSIAQRVLFKEIPSPGKNGTINYVSSFRLTGATDNQSNEGHEYHRSTRILGTSQLLLNINFNQSEFPPYLPGGGQKLSASCWVLHSHFENAYLFPKLQCNSDALSVAWQGGSRLECSLAIPPNCLVSLQQYYCTLWPDDLDSINEQILTIGCWSF